MNRRRIILILIILFAVALGLRLTMFWPVLLNPEISYIQGDTKTTDASYYHELGIELSQGKEYSSAYRSPGYPFFLSAFYKLTQDPNPIYPVLAQVALSSILIFLVFDLGALFFGRTVGLASSAVYALAPLPALFADRLMVETLGAIFYFLAIYFCGKALQRGEWREWWRWAFIILSGIALSVAIMVSPTGWYLLYAVPVLLFILIFSRQCVGCTQQNSQCFFSRVGFSFLMQGLAAAIIFFVFSMVFVYPWILRNERIYGERFFTTAQGVNLYWAFALNTIQEAEDLSEEQAVIRLQEISRDYELGLAHSDPVAARNTGKAALQIISKYPLVYAKIHAKGAIKGIFWLPLHGAGYKSQFFGFLDNAPVYVFMVGLHGYHLLYFLSFGFLMMFGYFLLLQRDIARRSGYFSVLLLCVSLYFLLIYGPIAGGRYRIFAFPVDSIIVGIAMARVVSSLKNVFKAKAVLWK